MSNESRTTVAFVPRETFSQTERALEKLYERTAGNFELICVDGGSPPSVQKYLEEASREKGFLLIRADGYISPNQARNLALDHVTSEYVVFVDNDCLVTPGWLDALVRCSDETGAWVVGPLYCEFEPEGERIHMSGGTCRITEFGDRGRSYVERHHNPHIDLARAAFDRRRYETELIEFHVVLVRMTVFERIGRLDPELTCMFEHGDLCLQVRQAGGSVFIEPEAIVTYVPPQRLQQADREYYQLRWSEAWMEATIGRLIEKYGLSKADLEIDKARGWVRHHRRHRLTWINELPRHVGDKWASRICRYIVAPFEIAHNRVRFFLRNRNDGSAKRVVIGLPRADRKS